MWKELKVSGLEHKFLEKKAKSAHILTADERGFLRRGSERQGNGWFAKTSGDGHDKGTFKDLPKQWEQGI
jgi:hypothetical protein